MSTKFYQNKSEILRSSILELLTTVNVHAVNFWCMYNIDNEKNLVGQIYAAPFSIRPEEALLCFCQIDTFGGRPSRRPTFSTLLTEIHIFKTILLCQNIKPSVENVLLHKHSVVDWSLIKRNQ